MKRIFVFLTALLLMHRAQADDIINTAIKKAQQVRRPVKVLVLIIASNNLPVYEEFKKVWRAYMKSNPKQIEAYFIDDNPSLTTEWTIKGDTIWSNAPIGIVPGVTNKTIYALEAMFPRFHQFDYILRTNLSSFYIFPRLLKFLQKAPSKNFYCAYPLEGSHCGSGAGFLMSPDVATLLVQERSHFIDNMSGIDDVLIGNFFTSKGIILQPHPRIDFLSLEEWHHKKDHIPSWIFQCRVKNNIPERRLQDDIFIHHQLLKKFYPKAQLK